MKRDYQNMPIFNLVKLIDNMHEKNIFSNNPRKLPLNLNDPRDVEWYRNDEAYNIIADRKKE